LRAKNPIVGMKPGPWFIPPAPVGSGLPSSTRHHDASREIWV